MESQEDERRTEGLSLSSRCGRFLGKGSGVQDGVYHVVGDGMHERTDGRNIRDKWRSGRSGEYIRLSENLLYLDAGESVRHLIWMPRKEGKNG